MDTKEKVSALAQKLLDTSELRTRKDGSEFYVFDDKSEAVTALFREAHNGMCPDDYVYQYINDALHAIVDGATEDDIYEFIPETIYHGEGVKWLASNLQRAEYVNEYTANNVGNKAYDIHAVILGGNMIEKEFVANTIYAGLVELVKKGDDSE